MSRDRALWVALLALAGATLACIGLGSGGLPAGEQAPNFGVKLGGETLTIEGLRGSVVVLNFWSSG
jgi:hypothetical protein